MQLRANWRNNGAAKGRYAVDAPYCSHENAAHWSIAAGNSDHDARLRCSICYIVVIVVVVVVVCVCVRACLCARV
jgi:hypothetical protein